MAMDSESLFLLHRRSPLFLLSAAALFFTAASGDGLCINYGRIANNLPPPEKVAGLIKTIHAARIRLYDTDQRVLRAFAGSGVELTVGLGNEYLASMQDPAVARAWVQSNISRYLPATKITSIAVGNEVLTSNGTVSPDDLLTAMENIQDALASFKLDKSVTVTTAHNLGILDVSYPPSAGTFRPNLTQILTRLLDFHCNIGSPFMVNAYPYFAYRDNPDHISLKFVLFEGDGIVDAISGLHYDNMFVAQLDAAHTAMEKLGYKNVCLQVSETGWPTRGDSDEAGATPEYARAYNMNLLNMINRKNGTPMRPDLDLNVYIFSLFNENLKLGPSSERNFGLFNPDMTPAYDLGFNLRGSGVATPSPSNSPMVVLSPPDGYMINNDAGRLGLNCEGAFLSVIGLAVSAVGLWFQLK